MAETLAENLGLDVRGVELAHEANDAYDLLQSGIEKEAYISTKYRRRVYTLQLAQELAHKVGEEETDPAEVRYSTIVEQAGALIGRERFI